MITIAVAADDTPFRQEVSAVLAQEPDYRVIGATANGPAALELVKRMQPTVLIIDLQRPKLIGLDVIGQVHALPDSPQMIVVSIHADEACVLQALQRGALAYVLRPSVGDELPLAVRAVTHGGRYLSMPLNQRAIEYYIARYPIAPVDLLEKLTLREREIFQHLADGLTNVAIADHLCISLRTVETHRANLMRKLGLHNHAQLVRFAIQCSLTTPAPVVSVNPPT